MSRSHLPDTGRAPGHTPLERLSASAPEATRERADPPRRQAGAGPLEAPVETLQRLDSYVFSRRLDQVMTPSPVTVGADATLRQAARQLTEHGVAALLVGRPGAAPQGIVTERDLLRAIAGGGVDPDAVALAQIMASPVETMPADTILYRAIGRMHRLDIRHLCVVDASGVAAGMVSERDMLGHHATSAMVLGDALAAAGDVTALAQIHGCLAEVAAGLVAEGLGGADVARVVSDEVRAMTARAAELTLARMAAEGHGTPPAPWCVLVLGSDGRGESLLGAHQQNALVHAGTEDDDGWFTELGTGMAGLLVQAGLTTSSGRATVADMRWRGCEQAWRERIDAWLGRAGPIDLRDLGIFLDHAPVSGDPRLARALHGWAMEATAGAPRFLARLAESVADTAPPLGRLGRIRADDDGRVDLDAGGLLPLVRLARTLALRVGSSVRATPDRLRAAAAGERLAEGDAASLMAVHTELMTLVLRQQLEDLEAGIQPSARIELKALDRATRGRLRGDLRALDDTLATVRGPSG